MMFFAKIKCKSFILIIFLGISCTVLSDAQTQEDSILFREASGIMRIGDTLIIVCDDSPEEYYKYKIDATAQKIVLKDSSKLRKCKLDLGPLNNDLESVDRLASGELVFLSENLRSLVTKNQLLIEYSRQFSEYGKRGLEGLAIRPVPSMEGRSVIAVLWEGGYPNRKDCPIETNQNYLDRAYSPIIRIDTLIEKVIDGGKGEIKGGTISYSVKEGKTIVLDMGPVNGWIDTISPRGMEPNAYRFRGPDLIWYKEGFIVLLSSERSPQLANIKDDRYGSKALQYFNLEGIPLTDPINLDSLFVGTGAKSNLNWEGLAWYEHNESFVLINDNKKAEQPTAVIIDIPVGW